MLIARRLSVMPFHAVFSRWAAVTLLGLLSACGGTEVSSSGQDTTNCQLNSNNSFRPPVPSVASSVAALKILSENFGTNPTIATAVVNGQVYVYVAWAGFGTFGQPYIFFRRSVDGGDTFEESQILSGTNNTADFSNPKIAASGNHVYLVWESATNGISQINLALSDKWGEKGTFSVRTSPLSNTARSSVNPAITATGDTVYVTWVDLGTAAGDPTNHLLVKSIDGGKNFSTPKNVTGTGLAALTPAALASDGDYVYVAWENSGSNDPNSDEVSDILFVVSSDSGETFSDPSTNLSQNLSSSRFPTLAAAVNHVYVIWDDFSGVNTPVLSLRISEDQGQNFAPLFEIQIAGTTTPHAAADGDNVFITWPNPDPQSCTMQIFFAGSSNQGQLVSTPVNISQNPESAQNPAIAAANGQAFVVWEGQQDSEETIFFYRPQIN